MLSPRGLECWLTMVTYIPSHSYVTSHFPTGVPSLSRNSSATVSKLSLQRPARLWRKWASAPLGPGFLICKMGLKVPPLKGDVQEPACRKGCRDAGLPGYLVACVPLLCPSVHMSLCLCPCVCVHRTWGRGTCGGGGTQGLADKEPIMECAVAVYIGVPMWGLVDGPGCLDWQAAGPSFP